MEGVIDRFTLAEGYTISRVIKGGWQLSDGHSDRLSGDPVADMFAFVERGIDTFDCADIYTGVEALIGEFIAANQRRAEAAAPTERSVVPQSSSQTPRAIGTSVCMQKAAAANRTLLIVVAWAIFERSSKPRCRARMRNTPAHQKTPHLTAAATTASAATRLRPAGPGNSP